MTKSRPRAAFGHIRQSCSLTLGLVQHLTGPAFHGAGEFLGLVLQSRPVGFPGIGRQHDGYTRADENAEHQAEQKTGITFSLPHQLFCSFPSPLGGVRRTRVCTMARVAEAAPATLIIGATTLSLTNVAVPLTVLAVSSTFSRAGTMWSFIMNAIH